MQNAGILPHNHGAAFLIRNGSGHIADQRQLTAQLMAAVPLHHQLYQIGHTAFPVAVEHASQRGAQMGINFCIQIIDALRKLAEAFLCIFHSLFPSL